MIIELQTPISISILSLSQDSALGDVLSSVTVFPSQSTSNPMVASSTTVSVIKEFKINIFYAPDIFKFIYGNNAIQSNTLLSINKLDFLELSPLENNSIESLIAALIAKNINADTQTVYTPKVDFTYWGKSSDEQYETDTIIIKFYNLLSTNDKYEILPYSSSVSPIDY